MLEQIRDFLGWSYDQKPVSDVIFSDTQIAAAALMVHAIAVDGVVRPEEEEALRQILTTEFSIPVNDIETLIAQAREKEQESVDLYSFTRKLNQSMSDEDRKTLIGDIWKLVFADGVVHEFEDNVVWRLADLMHISREDRIAMKIRARADYQREQGIES